MSPHETALGPVARAGAGLAEAHLKQRGSASRLGANAVEAQADALGMAAHPTEVHAVEHLRGVIVRLVVPRLGEVAGCGAFRALADVDYANACEMKRLYVRPAFRRFGLGRVLAQALIDDARRAGYSSMLLDTLDDMEAARGLYSSLGFEEIAPYYYNPIAGAHYLKVELGNFTTEY